MFDFGSDFMVDNSFLVFVNNIDVEFEMVCGL